MNAYDPKILKNRQKLRYEMPKIVNKKLQSQNLKERS